MNKIRKEELERLKNYNCLKHDDQGTTGIILSDEIEHLVEKCKLIDPFSKENLKPASYKLTVGDEYSIGGKTGRLSNDHDKDKIKVPPFEVVVIKTGETINMPRFMIGRWNLRVQYAYQGLLWVGGPHVDPGWVGHLCCPLYNLSNKPVTLKFGEPIVEIDFVKTTPFREGKSLEYPRPPENVILDDYNPEELESALYTQARERIDIIENQVSTRLDDIDNKVNRFGTRLDTSVGIIFAAIAVLVAAVSIFITSREPIEFTFPVWLYLSFGLSALALIFSIYSIAKSRSRKKDNPNGKSNKL